MTKKKLLISAASLALLGVGGYFGLAYTLPLAASQMIRKNGFPEARVDNLYVAPTGIIIDHIALDSNDFSTVDTIYVTLNWFDLILHQKIESISVKDISLTAELDEAGHFKIAGWDATLPSSSGASSLLPLQSILLQGITLDLDTPQGDIRIEGKLSLDTQSKDQQLVQYALWGQQHQLSFDVKGTGKIFANGNISLSSTLNDGRLNLPNIELSRASGQLDIQKNAGNTPPVYKGQLIAGKINTLGALLQNVNVTLDTTQNKAVFFETSPAGYKDITVKGTWMTQPVSHVEFNVQSAKSMDIVELLAPDDTKKYQSLLGKADPFNLSISAPLASLQSDTKAANYTFMAGNETSPQKIAANGSVSYNAANDLKTISFTTANLGIAGGTISASPFTVASDMSTQKPTDILLTISSVNMDELAKLADIDGLHAKGKLSGTLPVTYSKDGIVFGDGNLKNEGLGTFAYTPANFPPSLQGDDTRMQTVRQTLSDFRFTKLNIGMSGAIDGKMKTTLNAEGKNPALGDRPIQLNLNLDGDLGAVIKQTFKFVDIGGTIAKEN